MHNRFRTAVAAAALAGILPILVSCGRVGGPGNDYAVEQVHAVEAHLAPSYSPHMEHLKSFVSVGEIKDSTVVTERSSGQGATLCETAFPRGQAAADRFERFSKWVGSQAPLSPVNFQSRMLVLSANQEGGFWLVRLRVSKAFLAQKKEKSAWMLLKSADIALLPAKTSTHPLLLYCGTEVEKPGGFKAIRFSYRPGGTGTLDKLDIEKQGGDERVAFDRVSFLARLDPRLWLADVRHDALESDLSSYVIWCLCPRPTESADVSLQILGGPTVRLASATQPRSAQSK